MAETIQSVLDLDEAETLNLTDILYLIQGTGSDRDKKVSLSSIADFFYTIGLGVKFVRANPVLNETTGMYEFLLDVSLNPAKLYFIYVDTGAHDVFVGLKNIASADITLNNDAARNIILYNYGRTYSSENRHKIYFSSNVPSVFPSVNIDTYLLKDARISFLSKITSLGGYGHVQTILPDVTTDFNVKDLFAKRLSASNGLDVIGGAAIKDGLLVDNGVLSVENNSVDAKNLSTNMLKEFQTTSAISDDESVDSVTKYEHAYTNDKPSNIFICSGNTISDFEIDTIDDSRVGTEITIINNGSANLNIIGTSVYYVGGNTNYRTLVPREAVKMKLVRIGSLKKWIFV